MKRLRKRSKSGQNTAEYLVMLILVAVASIGAVTMFGKSLKKQFKNSIARLENVGEKDTSVTSDLIDMSKDATMNVQ